MPHRGGRVAIFTAAQETLIVDMVRENNLIRLREIRDKVIADNVNFESIDDVSLATIDRVLRRQKMRMKQVYRVPFERNSDHPDHVFKSTVVCNRFCFCIELCYSSVHAEFTIDLYSSYETHKSKCLILCRDLRRSITVKFLKICIGIYETKNLLTN